MSYAGPARSRHATRKAPPRSPAILPEHETDWQQVAVFGAGLALGLMLGAGVALLTAPHAGEETRSILRRKARRTSRAIGRHGTDAWLDVRNELHAVSRAISRRKARRLAERDLERESDSQLG